MVPLLQITESVGKQFLINYLPNYVRLSKELSYGIADVKIRGEYIYVMLEGINLTPKSFYDYFGVTTLNYNLESLSMNSSGNQMKIVLPIFQTLSNSNDAIGIIDIDLISLFQESFNTLDDQNKHALIISMGKNILYNNLSLFLLRIFNTL